MKKFEYKVERFTNMSSALYSLRDLGLKGWEVCVFNNVSEMYDDFRKTMEE